MGVHGLWDLLAPVGRRVSVETLAGKKLAIDASIWMIQFMKAMRDDKGEMVRNAHILGFFRRICKLLYLRTRPVFVFDGGTPALKRRTVIARRRQRENAQANIRKTAEKLLLNHLKATRLKELAADLQEQRQENDVKGKRPILQEPENNHGPEKRIDDMGANLNQEQFDEMLAASLDAEENEVFSFHPSTSGTRAPDSEVLEEEADDGDEEMMLPEMHGKIDPVVLAALPPSMQLDLLVQMRERLMAENRQKYQKVKQAPTEFSELQIQSYLKTVAFRREIDGVQKSAAGRGIGGMQTSRIASEANREFIFSSSFTGDKQTLTSVGQDSMISDQSRSQQANCPTGNANELLKSNGNAAVITVSETGKALDDVETYLDDRGRLRVSRVRALGIRMTRDLQRNLDLMKDIHLEKEVRDQEQGIESSSGRSPDLLRNSSGSVYHQGLTDQENNGINDEVNKDSEFAVVNGTSIEISFEDTLGLENGHDDDDAFFAQLVACDPMMDIPVDKSPSTKQFSLSTSNEWEEGVAVDRRAEQLTEGLSNDEEEVDWVEEPQDIKPSLVLDESKKTVSKGDLEEDVYFQEAIRRSLEDRGCQSMHESHENHVPESAREIFGEKLDMKAVEEADVVSADEGKEGTELESLPTGISQPFCDSAIISGEKFVAFLKLNPEENQLNLEHLNQDAGRNRAFAGEKIVTSDALPEEEEPFIAVRQPIDVRTEDSKRSAENKQVDCCIGEVSPNCRNSALGSSIANSLQGRLLNSGSVDAQDKALDDNSCSIAKLGKISADEPINDLDVAEPFAKNKLYSDPPIEKKKIMDYTSFMHDDEKEEIIKENLEDEIRLLDKECEELGSKQRKLERNAESVSGEMFAECQELLQMFGLPYIVAPMEAEAQCAFMELSNIVDGVVTDDSDAFLFGARSVYKNIFDDRKYVETYLMKDSETELGLDREKLISIALLLGSDYTEGISGIGIVNAIEVVNAFPGKDGLREFREWIESPDPSILGKMDTEAGGDLRKKRSKRRGSIHNLEGTSYDQNGRKSGDDSERKKQTFMDKHRNVSKNWHIPSSFPSDAVISAYLSPQVDKSTEPFSWGKPDLFPLRKLCLEKFGWVVSKADELLLPVLKEYNKHETQLRLEAFYTFNERFAKIRSKRIKKAVKGITGNISSEMMDGMPSQQPGKGRKRKVKPRQDEDEDDESGLPGADSSNLKGGTIVNKVVGWPKGRRNGGESSPSKLEQTSAVDDKSITRKRTHGRGGLRGRGNGPLSGKRAKKQNTYADTETSHDHSSCNEEEMQDGKSEESHPLRRGDRPRKSVNYYTVSDESNDSDNNFLSDVSAMKSSGDQAAAGGINKDRKNEIYGVDDVGSANRLFVDEAAENVVKVDETDTSKTDDSRKNDDLKQHSLSEDYLQLGGGFCFDENEAAEEVDMLASCHTTEAVPGGSELEESLVQESRNSGPLLLTPHRKTLNPDGDLKVSDEEYQNHYSTHDETKDDSMDQNTNPFRAMPNLRRKKKRRS